MINPCHLLKNRLNMRRYIARNQSDISNQMISYKRTQIQINKACKGPCKERSHSQSGEGEQGRRDRRREGGTGKGITY